MMGKFLEYNKLPQHVIHADWSTHPRKRWLAQAELTTSGTFRAHSPEAVGELSSFLEQLKSLVEIKACVLLGFDFPIGLPLNYALQAGIDDFLVELPELGQGVWKDFYTVTEKVDEISLRRPFYPQRAGGTSQKHLLEGLSCRHIDELRRVCERARPGRRAAAPLFWTLGGQQVGKAAISGWRDVLAPALRDPDLDLRIWPFSGKLQDLLLPGRVVAVETYPGEVYTHLGIQFSPSRPGKRSGKCSQRDRVMNAHTLLTWSKENRVSLDPELRRQIEVGYGPRASGEDPFDAAIGLFGMLNVLLGNQPAGEPEDPDVRAIEGWILGQPPGPRQHTDRLWHHV